MALMISSIITKEDLRQRVQTITDGKMADVLYDLVGGDMFDAAIRCIAWQGRYLVIGVCQWAQTGITCESRIRIFVFLRFCIIEE